MSENNEMNQEMIIHLEDEGKLYLDLAKRQLKFNF